MSLFLQTKDKKLQAFQRLMWAWRLVGDESVQSCNYYLKQFDQKDLTLIGLIEEIILKFGYPEGKRIIMDNVELEDDKDQLNFFDKLEEDFVFLEEEEFIESLEENNVKH